MDGDRLNQRLHTAYLILCVAYLIWMAVALVPSHRRQAARLKLLRSCARGMSMLARHAGEASMGVELETGEQLYGVPFRLAVWSDAAARAYQRARGVTP